MDKRFPAEWDSEDAEWYIAIMCEAIAYAREGALDDPSERG